MKVTLEFNLPEEREEYEQAINAGKFEGIVDRARQYVRARLKYEELTNEQIEVLEKVQEVLYEQS